ncbi:ABC transporter permease subunit [Verminephrobacter sp. Larva24]|nr:ABC transporter permease subunit [Verminephrobacter sp. Larva24]
MLDRRYKPARLNPAGTLLCERARAVLNSYRQFYETVADTADLAGVLAVGASPTVLTTVIPKTLVALRSAHPRIQIRMQYGRAWNLLKDLQHGQIDALIISQPPVSMGNTQWTQFAQEPVTVIAPPGAKGRNDESLLAEYPYIRFGQRFWVADTIAAHLAERGIVPQQIMQADSREAIALMVRHGLGVSIVPESDPPLSKLYGLREVALGKPPLTRNIGLAQTPGNPKQALIDALLAGDGQALWSAIRHLLLPALTLGFVHVGVVARQIRSALLDQLQQDYVRTARAGGLSAAAVVLQHALPNALIPSVTVLGLAFGDLLYGAVLTETVFAWPGMGSYVVASIQALDFPAVMGFTVVVSFVYVLVNLAVDLVYLALDPRITGVG